MPQDGFSFGTTAVEKRKKSFLKNYVTSSPGNSPTSSISRKASQQQQKRSLSLPKRKSVKLKKGRNSGKKK